MLAIHQIQKSYGTNLVLDSISFSIKRGERLGLIGPNGAGKSTLQRILAGIELPDRGSLAFTPPNLRRGYLPQGLSFVPGETIGGYIGQEGGDLAVLGLRLEELAAALTSPAPSAQLQREYDAVLDQIDLASQGAGRGPEILSELGLSGFSLDTPVANLSGGQKTRLGLARVLISSPQLLLLDEPTNHLDMAMLTWLENWLASFRGAVLLVSHDRTFLDRTVTGILELDPRTHKITAYEGNFSSYMEAKAGEEDRHRQEYSDQQEEIARLRAAAAHMREIAQFRKGGKADSGDKFARGFFANRGKETVGRARGIEARIEQMMTEDRVDKPRPDWQMKLEFQDAPAAGRDGLILEDAAVGYGQQPLLTGLNLTLRAGTRCALIGPNGSGKTTLIRTIMGEIPALRGTIRLGAQVRLGYMAQEQENLNPAWNSLETILHLSSYNETEARSFLSKFLIKGDDVFIPTASLSYGERARLTLAGLVARGCNIMILDEPINHLDIPSRTRFEQALAGFQGAYLAAIHDRFFIDAYATETWEISAGTIRQTIVKDRRRAKLY